jgi:hypothetical protein
MITIEEVEELSKKIPVYNVTIHGCQFFYKEINIGEFVKIKSATTTNVEFEDCVVMVALLYTDTNIDKLPAGVLHVLSNCILKNSDFDMDNWQVRIDEKKKDITPSKINKNEVGFTNPVIPLIIQICRAFPSYKPEDLFNLSVDELLERVAWADIMLGNFEEVNTNRSKIPGEVNIDSGSIETPKKWSYTQQDLERMSAQASANALAEEMRNHLATQHANG